MSHANLPQWKCHKVVRAAKMNRADYNALRGWQVPADENPADDGYLVECIDGGPANHPDFKGYISWSPVAVFESGYKPLPPQIEGLPGHQQRVVMEAEELRERLDRLTKFIGDGACEMFVTLPLEERQDLQVQRVSMRDYLMALDSRIRRFLK